MNVDRAWKLPLLLVAACGMAAVAAEKAEIAVVEKKGGAVGFYTAEGKRIAGVETGKVPHEIILSPDKRLAYVSDNGILWMTEPGAGGNTITIVDVQARKKHGVITLGKYRRPHGMDIDAKTNRMVVTVENPDGLLLIDLNTNRILRNYDVKGAGPHMVKLGPGGGWAYVSNTTSGTVAAVNLESGDVKLIPTAARPQGAVCSLDGRLIYLVNSSGNSISIIDHAKKTVVGSIATGNGPGRIAITPDGRTLVYNMQQEKAVGFADIATRKQTTVLPLGGEPLSLTMTADGRLAYAGIQDQDRVAVISVADRKVIREIRTPKDAGPDPALPLP